MLDDTPLIGPDGDDRDGYPNRHVNRLLLRRMLQAGQYAELTKHIESFQSDFESNPRCEYWPFEAAETFESAETELRAKLDAWVAATPASFAPYLARGSYLKEVGYALRGRKYLKNTDEVEMKAMAAVMPEAIADLDKALSLRPKLVIALRNQINAAQALGDRARVQSAAKKALTLCPSCLIPRITIIQTLRPRWGGNYTAMDAFAQSSATTLNPRFAWLAGYQDMDRAELAFADKNYVEAIRLVDRALRLGENPYALDLRASYLAAQKDYMGAESTLSRALELRPLDPEFLERRAFARSELKRWEPAGRDLLDALRIRPTQSRVKNLLDSIVYWLATEAWNLRDTPGRQEEAMRMLELALDLKPNDPYAEQRRVHLLMGTRPTATDELEKLREAVKANPYDFRAVQTLDYALSKQRKFEEILPLWNEYLTKHPDDARALSERSGTLHHLGRDKESRDDARRACDLGDASACKYAGPR